MAKVVVDSARCTGHGRCYGEAEELLGYDEEGYVAVRHADLVIAAGQVSLARSAAAACPEGAMTVIEED